MVAACSYEARKFGIHSAMASSTAYRLCPDAVFIRPRFDMYRAVSEQIREIFCEYTDLVEPLSLDEAFLDVTENYLGMPSATLIAREIKKKIYERTGKLTASAGVSFNKFIAKVASDMNKPDGITVITPGMADEFIDRLPIRKFFGVGKVTEEKMLGFGIKTGADLKKFNKEKLIQLFGKSGSYFFNIAHGDDERPVEPNRIRKSIGKETTLIEDIDDTNQMVEILAHISFGDFNRRVTHVQSHEKYDRSRGARQAAGQPECPRSRRSALVGGSLRRHGAQRGANALVELG